MNNIKKPTQIAGLAIALTGAFLWTGPAISADTQAAADDASPYLRNGTIAYVISGRHWGLYQTEGAKEECPNGVNTWGPREQFKALFLQDGKKRTVEESQLAREGAIWHPTLEPDQFPFMEAAGKIAYGINLDGKVDANDFTSPEGEPGIDNQLFRAIGCNENFRGPTGIMHNLANQFAQRTNYNRVLLELTDVDSLTNDDHVEVTIYRGRDRLLADATGNEIIPGGTQRLDLRWGKRYTTRFAGKIVGGTLLTEPADFKLPHGESLGHGTEEAFLGAQFKIKLTPQRGEGILAAYVNIDSWYYQLNKSWRTIYQSYGQLASQSLYKKLHQLADGYPDPQTGKNTALSAALSISVTQVYIEHPNPQVAVAGSSAREASRE
jgi:hypothetical protein